MPVWKGIVGKDFSADEFDAYVRGITFNSWRPQFVVLHNTAAPKLSEWHSVPGQRRILNLENYYRNIQKWSAGPHLFIADDRIWVFTPLNTSGVHSPSWNAISWGVEMVGDYEVEPFGDDIKGNVVSALTTLHAVLGLDPATLKLHKEDPLTTHICPGKNVVKQDVIDAVQNALAEQHPGEHGVGAAS